MAVKSILYLTGTLKANSLISITRQVLAQMFARKITDATFNMLH